MTTCQDQYNPVFIALLDCCTNVNTLQISSLSYSNTQVRYDHKTQLFSLHPAHVEDSYETTQIYQIQYKQKGDFHKELSGLGTALVRYLYLCSCLMLSGIFYHRFYNHEFEVITMMNNELISLIKSSLMWHTATVATEYVDKYI